jgi:hypothetical protein
MNDNISLCSSFFDLVNLIERTDDCCHSKLRFEQLGFGDIPEIGDNMMRGPLRVLM